MFAVLVFLVHVTGKKHHVAREFHYDRVDGVIGNLLLDDADQLSVVFYYKNVVFIISVYDFGHTFLIDKADGELHVKEESHSAGFDVFQTEQTLFDLHEVVLNLHIQHIVLHIVFIFFVRVPSKQMSKQLALYHLIHEVLVDLQNQLVPGVPYLNPLLWLLNFVSIKKV